jgi:hypothetical protein
MRKHYVSIKKRLFVLSIMIVSWYTPGIVNKTLADVRELGRAVKSIFL